MTVTEKESKYQIFGLPDIWHCGHFFLLFVAAFFLFFMGTASAHDVSVSDKGLISSKGGLQIVLYLWLGAKHMVTGYDHLLFLLGVVFYLKRFQEVILFVSLFALGHTITLISGVLLAVDVNVFMVDAIIGLSVAYKGLDNLGALQRLFGEKPDERAAVFIFGLFHGLGLASKLQDLGIQADGLLVNLIAFNLGVELGQILALAIIVLALHLLNQRLADSGVKKALNYSINIGLVVAGFTLMAYQLAQI